MSITKDQLIHNYFYLVRYYQTLVKWNNDLITMSEFMDQYSEHYKKLQEFTSKTNTRAIEILRKIDPNLSYDDFAVLKPLVKPPYEVHTNAKKKRLKHN